MSYTATITATYSTVDVENVIRNFAADLRMIAESTATWSRDQVENYVSDVSYLAKRKYLSYVDLTLLHAGVEVRAVRYTVNETSGELTTSRPGGVLWPRLVGATLRIVIGTTAKWESEPPDRSQLKISWSTSTADISHSRLKVAEGRNFTSNAYGLLRKDYTA
jgi:hypothetical protein